MMMRAPVGMVVLGVIMLVLPARAEIILEEKLNVLLVPEAAVVYDKERKASVEVPDATAEKGRRYCKSN